MIGNLNKVRHLLQEILPEKGVTDPVSGPVFDENSVDNWRNDRACFDEDHARLQI